MSELNVVFGTGALGQAVMRELLRKGRRVRMVSRTGKFKGPAGVESLAADAGNEADAIRACAGAEVVYHCAAPPYHQWAELYPAMGKGILAGAAAAGAKLISAESLYMYGKVDRPMVETMPYAATTRKGRIRAEMAETLLEAHRAGKARVAIGRAPDYYGPGAEIATIYSGQQVFYPVLEGKTVRVMGKLDLPHSFLSVDDFARGLVTLGERDEALGQVWHLPCPPPITQRELLQLIFDAAGKPFKAVETPNWLIRVLGLFIPIMRELSELLYQWDAPYLYSFEKFERAFGASVTPHAQAVRETVASFRKPAH